MRFTPSTIFPTGYTYDANGNRLTKNSTSYTYDDADEMTAAGGVSYGYDGNGNETSRGGDTFTYDHENRLTQSVIAGATSSSVYNGGGLRVSHTVSGVTTNYTWDATAKTPVVLQDGTNTYVYGLGLVSTTDGTGTQSYFLDDGLGSVTGLTDGSGNTVASYSYDVFGAIRTQTGSSPNYWLFTGQQRDADSSFYFLRARYYDPSIGRFLARDRLPTGNLYAYVGNNPVNLQDPSGLCANSCEGGFADPGCNPLLGCWSINYDKILRLLPEYLACVAFGIALVAFLVDNPWLAAAAIGTDVAGTVLGDGDDAAKSAGVGVLGGAGRWWVGRAAKEWKPKYQSWDQMGAAGFGKTLTAFALAYSGWGCAKKVGILEAAGV